MLSCFVMKAFDKLKQGVAAVREGGAEVIAAARKGHGGPASDGPQDPTDYLRHMTMNSNSNNSEYSRSSGQRSGLGQRSGPQRSGMQKNAGAGTVSWFGVPLSTQPCDLDRGRRVPKLLGALRRALEEGCGMEQEGVFRQSADGRLLTFIRQRLEAGEDPEAVLEGCSTEALSTLLKAWFSELPGGVWISGEEDAPKAKKGGKKGPATDGGRELESQLISAAHAGMPTAMLLKQGVRPQQREVPPPAALALSTRQPPPTRRGERAALPLMARTRETGAPGRQPPWRAPPPQALLWLLDVLCEAATHSVRGTRLLSRAATSLQPSPLSLGLVEDEHRQPRRCLRTGTRANRREGAAARTAPARQGRRHPRQGASQKSSQGQQWRRRDRS